MRNQRRSHDYIYREDPLLWALNLHLGFRADVLFGSVEEHRHQWLLLSKRPR
jgi:hypothetical protein